MPENNLQTNTEGESIETKPDSTINALSSIEISGTLKIFEEEIKVLKKQASATEKEFDSLEKRTDKATNLIQSLTIGIAIAFFIALALLSFDYMHGNSEDYKKYLDTTQQYYSKNEINSLFKSFKDCIWLNGLSYCLK